MNRTKLCKVLLVTVAPLAFATAANAGCSYDNFTSAWICDPLDQVVIGGSGGGSTGGGTGTGYPGGSSGGGSLPGYGGVVQIVQYVRSHRQYCRLPTQSCATWGRLAASTRAQGGYDLCTNFASKGSLGWHACMDQFEMMAFGLDSQATLCADVAC